MAIRYVRGIAATAAVVGMLGGCAAPVAPQGNVSARPTTTAAITAPFALLTHCGIYEARVQDTFFVADQLLDDGNGNPLAGWDNPYQSGTITVQDEKAVFHDDRGHIVTFHERPGATSYLRTCS
ncbi:hypothetical protein [Arthrobacter sp. AZCC_0090]|uniref:hypothetical protein n=1 Tax=Arthrobacter sp. AZCC_0090 TaxID=2735881 RepID=UPI0016093F8B|nr:hypothetical protein [Arthrobacter sp. AZCC_0090]MBB6402782.1 hypothetical protein [Arthrobacter sp. AZCC_0090]